ncbi:MAG: ankyrin repeat domain-containing protein, partial [Verrucomicrobiota bacterium]
MKTKFITLTAITLISLSAQAAFVGIHSAAAAGDVDRLKEYLAKDPTLISARNGPNRTPLCIAAMRGQTNAVEFLITHGADVNDKGFFELTPLGDMAMYGMTNDQRCAGIATILLAHGAEVNPMDGYGATPLLHAVEMRKSQLARVLLEHGATQTLTYKGANSGTTPLHMAIGYGDKDMVAALLEFNPPLTTK